jgi:ornithine--oxo-acid transaminase
MDVFQPGTHGSTFGGNALAAAVGLEALNILVEDELVEHSRAMGEYFLGLLQTIKSPLISDLRGKGLFIGMEIDPAMATAREVCVRLMKKGLLSKETHETVVRFAPPLIVNRDQLAWAADQIRDVLADMDQVAKAS